MFGKRKTRDKESKIDNKRPNNKMRKSKQGTKKRGRKRQERKKKQRKQISKEKSENKEISYCMGSRTEQDRNSGIEECEGKQV